MVVFFDDCVVISREDSAEKLEEKVVLLSKLKLIVFHSSNNEQLNQTKSFCLHIRKGFLVRHVRQSKKDDSALTPIKN